MGTLRPSRFALAASVGQAQELLSRLEAEDFLRELETEEETRDDWVGKPLGRAPEVFLGWWGSLGGCRFPF